MLLKLQGNIGESLQSAL
jgi:hypothetical protein